MKHHDEQMLRVVAELHAQPVSRSLGEGGFAESAKPEQAITVNLPARHIAQRDGGRGLGYGG